MSILTDLAPERAEEDGGDDHVPDGTSPTHDDYRSLPADFPDRCVAVLDEVVRRTPGGKRRPGQEQAVRDFARIVAGTTTLRGASHALEAGTGTGKSYVAVIVAAMAAVLGERGGPRKDLRRTTILATATKLLQDQYVEDIEMVRSIMQDMGLRFDWAVLKGAGNYLCRAAWDDLHDPKQMALMVEHNTTPDDAQIARIATWLNKTETGDLAEIPVQLTAKTRAAVTVADGECTGPNCRSYEACYATDAKRKARDADLVVINTKIAMLAADRGGLGLPDHAIVIMDEAHKVEDIAADTLGGTEFRPMLLDTIAGRIKNFLADDPIEHAPRLKDLAQRFEVALRVRLDSREKGAYLLPLGVTAAADLEPLRDEAKQILNSAKAVLEALQMGEQSDGRRGRIISLIESCLAKLYMLAKNDPDVSVMFVKKDGARPVIATASLEVAEALRETAWVGTVIKKDMQGKVVSEERHHRAVLAMSATLPSGTEARLGLIDSQRTLADSPFDYKTNSLLYVPDGLPEPTWDNRDTWRPLACNEATRLAILTGGRALMLFSSFREMEACAAVIRPELRKVGIESYLESEDTKKNLISWMRNSPGGVVFASQGWFEGVNLPGDCLRLVIMFTIPLPPPGDPLNDGRMKLTERRLMEAGNKGAKWDAFRQTSGIKAASAAGQAAGRLIRTTEDVGIVALMDPRVFSKKTWGPMVLKAMPPMPITRSMFDVEMFAAGMPAPNDRPVAVPLTDDDEDVTEAPTVQVVEHNGTVEFMDEETGEMVAPRTYTDYKQVPAGHYAIAGYTGEIFIRVTVSDKGFRVVDMQVGPAYKAVSNRNQMDYLNRVIRAGVLESSALYGQKIGRCGRCGQDLTNKVSRKIGIGPDCAKYLAGLEAA